METGVMGKGGSLVWARNAFRRDQLWPGVILPEGTVPDYIQRLRTPGRLCVCFYGPSIAQSRARDYFWLPAEEITAWADYCPPGQPALLEAHGDYKEDFENAYEEALSVDAGYLEPTQGRLPKVDPSAPCCLCCGKQTLPKEAAAAKEQGDRCGDCQQLYLAGQYCVVCNRVWFDYESRNLAECKRCGARVHGGCDLRAERTIKVAAADKAAAAVKQEQQEDAMDIDQQHQQQLVSIDGPGQQQLQETCAPYNCPACCQKEADESRMDLLHLHAVVLADMKPSKPRPAAEIFAAEVTRKHLSTGAQLDLQLLQGVISKAWVDEEDKGKYERQAQQEQEAFLAGAPQYEALFRQYVNLAASLRREVDLSLALEPQRVLGSGSLVLARGSAAAPQLSIPASGPPQLLLGHGSSTRGQQQPGQLQSSARTGAAVAAASGAVSAPAAASGSNSQGARGGRPAHVSVLGSGTVIKAEDGSEVPQQIPIICNTTRGTFLLAEMKVICSCKSCAEQPREKRTFSATQFEQHGGAGSAKKWKASLRIEPGAVPECPPDAAPMAFGKWMDIKGIEAKGSKVAGAHPTPPAAEVAQMLLDGPAASVKREPRQPEQQQQQRYSNTSLPAGPATSGDGFATPPGAGGPSPASSSRGPGDGSAAGAAAGAAAATSSAEQKPVTTSVPKNRRPSSWTPWEDVNLGQYKPIQVKFAGDRCCVCDGDVDFDVDRLVSCDGCGITVHQICYGVPELPDEDDMWLCRSCELKEPGAPEPQCCLCPMTGGGLKPTTLPGLWAHAACMQWIPEVSCLEPLRMEPIDRIQHIQKERWELLCCICRQRMGAKIQCNDCYRAYHPLCARRLGLHMEMVEPAVPDGPMDFLTFCPRHCKPRPEKSGITLVTPDDAFHIGRPRKRNDAAGGSSSTALADTSSSAAADAINNGLWNAQPFQCNKPPAPVPAPPGGSARATAFNAKQICHGTGTGRTSIAGFWIPTADSAGAAAAAASEQGGVCSSSTTGGGGVSRQEFITSGAAAAAGGKAGRKKRRWGKGSSSSKVQNLKTAARPKAGKLCASGEPPPIVELVPLPEGVPDRIPVVCNGKSAVFILRPQRVLHGDAELTASRFEQLCGKGDAKKWKSSLWAAKSDGEPDISMGDWLNSKGMDKAVLSKLVSNWNAFELRQTWEQQQKQKQQRQPETDGKGAEEDQDEQQQQGSDIEGEDQANDVDAATPEASGRAESSVGDGATTDVATPDDDDVTEGTESKLKQQQPENAAAAAAADDVSHVQDGRLGQEYEVINPRQQQQQQQHEFDAEQPAAKRLKHQQDVTSLAAPAGEVSNGIVAADSPPAAVAVADDVVAAGALVGQANGLQDHQQQPQQQQERKDADADAMAGAANGLQDHRQQQQQQQQQQQEGGSADAETSVGAVNGLQVQLPQQQEEAWDNADAETSILAADDLQDQQQRQQRQDQDQPQDGAADKQSAGSPSVSGLQVVPLPQQPQQLQQLQLQDHAAEVAIAIAHGIVAPAGAAPAAATPAAAADQPAGAAPAAATRQQKGLVLLRRLRYNHLPPLYKLHSKSLPPQAAAAAAASDGSDQPVSAASDPWSVVGRCCRMFWPDDDAWYEADVTSYSSGSGKHTLWYHLDEVSEEIDLVQEEREARVQWLPLVDKLKWPKPPEKHQQRLEASAAGGVAGLGQCGLGLGSQPLDGVGMGMGIGFQGLGSGFVQWQQGDAVATGWGQQQQLLLPTLLQQQQLLLPNVLLQQQQQQQQGPSLSTEDQSDATAVHQAAQLPDGFPRITAMIRDPTDFSSVDLTTLNTTGVNLQQQMQRMLQQQQDQFMQYSAAQPAAEDTPTGAAAVGWRVGVFSAHAGAFYYGLLTSYRTESNCHKIEYDDQLSEDLQLQQQARLDWVTAAGEQLSQAGKAAHEAYMQQRLAAAAAEQQQQQQQQGAEGSAGVSAGSDVQQQQFIVQQLQLQVQQAFAEIQQLGLPPGAPVPLDMQQRVQQLLLLLQHHQHQLASSMQQQQQQQQPVVISVTVTPSAAAAGAESPIPAAVVGPKPGPKPGAPTQVDIICSSNTAVFDCTRMAVLTPSGSYVSPTEFERLSGKGSSKKWKCTIRVRKANGLPGITMGDWLIQMGYDQPKQPGVTGENSTRARASLNDIRRQFASRKAAAGGAGPAAAKRPSSSGAAEAAKPSAAGVGTGGGQSVVTARGVALHRDGCMCVICKQARRKAAQEAGLRPNPEDAYTPRQPGEGKIGYSSKTAGYSGSGKTPPGRGASLLGKDSGTLAAAADQAEQRRKKLNLPSVLVGKRAYVRAVPQLVRGAAVHQLWQIPESRCYSAVEWEALQLGSSSGKATNADGGPSADGAAAVASSRAGTPSLAGSRPPTPPLSAAADSAFAAADVTAAAGAIALAGDLQQQQQQEDEDGKQQLQLTLLQPEKQEKKGSRTETWREKLRVCQVSEPKRITFGKSGIHGWGIFARDHIHQDTMVTEFRGQLVRCILADVREHQYRKEHRDCYMFHATDETVIDNTRGGNYARFCNHCCYPCLYAKPLELGGELHLCFFARTGIKIGQELTFDYRFKEEEGDDKILCQCGAPNCKGTLN